MLSQHNYHYTRLGRTLQYTTNYLMLQNLTKLGTAVLKSIQEHSIMGDCPRLQRYLNLTSPLDLCLEQIVYSIHFNCMSCKPSFTFRNLYLYISISSLPYNNQFISKHPLTLLFCCNPSSTEFNIVKISSLLSLYCYWF